MAFSSCSVFQKANINVGKWRGNIVMDSADKSLVLPFNMVINQNYENKYRIVITNSEEMIPVTEIECNGKNAVIKLPVFKDEINVNCVSKDSLVGEYIHYGSKSKYSMPFFAVFDKADRFPDATQKPFMNISGRWETTVQPGDSNEYKIIGEFRQKGNHLDGTFLTASGDYRFLEGAVSGKDVMLSCVDGTHTLLFKAKISEDSTLENGILVGGPKWRERWRAVRNPAAELADPELQSQIKDSTEEINFSLSGLDGKNVSLSDMKYQGKPVIIQIMGSWCPNCMDETKFFSEIYNSYKKRGLEIMGLCFESADFNESKDRIKRFVNALNANYDFLYAGETGNKYVMQTLPFLKEFKGYPTTIYLNKQHKVFKIYTGFSGPGTGVYYEKLKSEIINSIEKILM
jgi:thiol-disulfide isomerase/thioredoxin